MKNPIIEEPFENHFQHTINPGDKVVCISSGYCHQIHIREGIFLGYLMNGAKISSVAVRVKTKRFDYNTRKYREVEKITSLPKARVYPLKEQK